MKKIELLAPAGNFDCLKAAVNNGADAVYLGGSNFSARAFANNFNNDELKEAVEYCHLRFVKVYVTVNTLLDDNELEIAFKQVKYLYSINVDALIIQDLGLYTLIKKELPDFEIHASTQMHIHNVEGVKTVNKLGFKRVVLARESSIELIKECCKQGIEIETFIHGALCVSYSGQCLLSSVTKNRSANKGMCAQCCRLAYKLFDKDTNNLINTDTKYLLSPKDMFLLEDIPLLINAGVTSLKIEGRMKGEAYVGYVTKVYRNAIDAYYNNQKYVINDNQIENLKYLFNRGFTNSYLLDNNNDIFSNMRPNHMGVEIGKVVGFKNGKCIVNLNKTLNQFDGIRILNKNEDIGFIVNMMEVNHKLVNKAEIGDNVHIKIDSKVNVGDVVVKTLDYQLEKEVNNISPKQTAIDLDITIFPNTNIQIKCSYGSNVFTYISNVIPQNALNAPIDINTVRKQFSKLNETPFILNNLILNTSNAFLTIKEINDLRRDFISNLTDHVLNSFSRATISSNYDITISDYINEPIVKSEKSFNNCLNIPSDYYFNYPINTKSVYKNNEKEVVTELGRLFANTHKIAYYTLNCYNSYAFEFLRKLGFECIILSTELNDNQIDLLINKYNSRCNENIKPHALVYGRRALMYIKRSPIIKYAENRSNLQLIDHENRLYINENNGITELIETDNKANHEQIIEKINKFIILDENECKNAVNFGLVSNSSGKM